MSKPKNYEMVSVKRLSDGKIFSIGDYVKGFGETFDPIVSFKVGAFSDKDVLVICTETKLFPLAIAEKQNEMI